MELNGIGASGADIAALHQQELGPGTEEQDQAPHAVVDVAQGEGRVHGFADGHADPA